MSLEIKYIDNPAQFLLDTGLLFEINRQVLHPLGLALEVTIDKDGKRSIGGIWDYMKDPEGIVYGEESFESGMKKLKAFMGKHGDHRLQERYERLGYRIQGEE